MGFADAATTGAGADGGVDVRASGMVAQVKAHMTPVGRPDLQRIYGIGRAENRLPVFFSLMSYTSQAMRWANSVDMPVFRFNHAGEVDPVSPAAVALFDAAEQVGGRPNNSRDVGQVAFKRRFKTYTQRYTLLAAIWLYGTLGCAIVGNIYHLNAQCPTVSLSLSCKATGLESNASAILLVWPLVGALVVSHFLIRGIPKVFQSSTVNARWKKDGFPKQVGYSFGALGWAAIAFVCCLTMPPPDATIAITIQWLISCAMPILASMHPMRLTGRIKSPTQ